jgi:hypothetical protein
MQALTLDAVASAIIPDDGCAAWHEATGQAQAGCFVRNHSVAVSDEVCLPRDFSAGSTLTLTPVDWEGMVLSSALTHRRRNIV